MVSRWRDVGCCGVVLVIAPSAVVQAVTLEPGFILAGIAPEDGDTGSYDDQDSNRDNYHSQDVIKCNSMQGVCFPPHVSHGHLVRATGNDSNQLEIACKEGYRFPHIKSLVLHLKCQGDHWVDILVYEDVPACEIPNCPKAYPVAHANANVGGIDLLPNGNARGSPAVVKKAIS